MGTTRKKGEIDIGIPADLITQRVQVHQKPARMPRSLLEE